MLVQAHQQKQTRSDMLRSEGESSLPEAAERPTHALDTSGLFFTTYKANICCFTIVAKDSLGKQMFSQ
jgi:hypothetical protein